MDTPDASAERPAPKGGPGAADRARHLQHETDSQDEVVALSRLLLTTDSFDGFLAELAEYAAKQTEHTCSITVGPRDGAPYTVVSTDELTLALDERQYEDGRGPCLEALTSKVPVFVTDMTTETRWMPYPKHAAELGARSSMSYPLINNGDSMGALNMYAFRPWAPDAGIQARAAQLADRAAGALAVAMRLAEQSAESTNLRTAMESRSVIDQAMGILMAQQRCNAAAAFALMRQASQSRNIKLRDVAAQIVSGVERKGGEKPGGRY